MTLPCGRILLVSPKGYDVDIKRAFESLGFEVDLVNDKPNEGFVCKASVRLGIRAYRGVVRSYYRELLERRSGGTYQYVIVIRGEFFYEECLAEYRRAFPHAEFVLYLWDSIANYPAIENRLKCFDRVLTFDRDDALRHSELQFRPLFFSQAFEARRAGRSTTKDYTLSFFGTAHSDRPTIVEKVADQCAANGETFYAYWFTPFAAIYYYNRLTNASFKGIERKSVHTSLQPKENVADVLLHSFGTIDIEHPKQTGLTMRTIESIGLGIKLLTTNKDIVHYDFFDSENVMVVDRDNPIVDFDFLKSPYFEPSDGIYEKYSICGWAREVLGMPSETTAKHRPSCESRGEGL